jgi:phage terminase large subunit
MSATLPIWQTAWAEAAKGRDPLRFVEGVLEVTELEAWQREALGAIRDGQKRISIRSGHGVGKTTFLAWLVLYGLLCLGPDTKIPIAAGSRDQLRDTIQPEIGKWARRLPQPLQDQVKVDVERVAIKAAPDDAFAVFRTASKDNPQALAGFHAENIIFLLDEASAIAEIAFEVALGALSTPGAMVIMTGNPTKTQGFFYDSHHKTRDRWWTMRVSSEDVPRARGHIEDVIATYGKDSNRYRVRVLGEFPTQDDETVIPLDLVLAAVGREIAEPNVWPVWGVDVGRMGDDRSVLAKRQHVKLLEPPKVWRKMEGPQVAGRIIAEYQATPNHLRPREIVVDLIGFGASVYDILRLDGSPVREITRGAVVSELPAISEQDYRLRDELWFRGRAFFAERNCSLPKDNLNDEEQKIMEQFISELTMPTYTYTSLGKRIVEKKKDVKSRSNGVSPDLADAFLLSLAAGIYPKSNPHRRSETKPAGSWLAA